MDRQAMWNEMISVIKQDVTPATGCTEPIALAYAAATAARKLGEPVRFVDGWVSANLMKNGMGVTVPGTGMPGLYIAAAVGALGGDDEAGLQVLKALTPDVVALAKQYVADGKITVSVREDTPHVLYAEAVVYGENHRVRVVITDDHTNIVFIEKDGKVLRDQRIDGGSGEDPKIAFLHRLTLADIVDFAEQVPLKDIAFLKEAERLNDHLSQEGLTGKYGLKIGYTLQQLVEKGVLADDLSHRIQIRTVAPHGRCCLSGDDQFRIRQSGHRRDGAGDSRRRFPRRHAGKTATGPGLIQHGRHLRPRLSAETIGLLCYRHGFYGGCRRDGLAAG